MIPTAAYWSGQGADIAYGLITGASQRLTSHGWKSVGVLELTALPSIPEDAGIPRVRETDVFLVGGGDPMYLCRWLRESGFADLMSSLSDDVVWVGTSGGAMAVTASFGENYNDRPVPATGPETPLSLVDIAIYPHLDHPAMDDTRPANVAAWAQSVPVPAYGIDDSTAIRVVDGAVDVVSEGHWEVFGGTPGGPSGHVDDHHRSG